MKLEEFARESRATHKGDKSGVPIVGLEHLIPQEIKFSGYDVDTENTFTKTFKKGQILFGRRRAYLKKAAIADFDGICSGDITVIEAIPGKVDPLLLPFIIQNDKFFDYAVSRSAGGLSPRVKWEHLKDYEFDLPPIEEQRILADKLWAAYRLKESYKKLLTATQEMVKSQFIEIFYGMETTPVKDYIDDSFPGEWGTEDKDGNGVKVIRTTNFTNSGKLNLADVVTRSIEDRKVVRKQIKKYDTILERSGGTADNPVGRVVLFEEDNLFLCNNFTQVLRFKDVDPRFAFYALYYFYQTNRTAIRSMGSKTTGIQNLNMSKYLEIGIPNASDEDQKAFVTIAEQADKSEFVGCKSQFIEMFGDTHMRSDHSRQWKEVVEIINGKDYKSIQVEDGGYPVYGTGGEMARASDYLSPANSILLGRKGTIDKPLLIREKYWNVDTAFGAVPDEKVLHYVYFYWHCKTIDFNVLNKGTTLPSTTKVDLLNLWIKIPSMEEQTRFGSIVEQADKSEFVGCKSQFIEMYYNTHNKQTLESVCPIMNKGITPKYVESSSVLVINQACIHWDGQRLGNIKYHNEEIPVRKRILESGDVLLNATGNGTLGRCCVFICPSDNNTYINDGHVIALSTDRAVILPEVLNTYLSLNDTQAEIYRQYVTGSTNQVDIVFSDIKKMKVPVPSMDEQILFVEVLTQADKSEFELRKSIEAIDQVIKSLINN